MLHSFYLECTFLRLICVYYYILTHGLGGSTFDMYELLLFLYFLYFLTIKGGGLGLENLEKSFSR